MHPLSDRRTKASAFFLKNKIGIRCTNIGSVLVITNRSQSMIDNNNRAVGIMCSEKFVNFLKTFGANIIQFRLIGLPVSKNGRVVANGINECEKFLSFFLC